MTLERHLDKLKLEKFNFLRLLMILGHIVFFYVIMMLVQTIEAIWVKDRLVLHILEQKMKRHLMTQRIVIL